jgi:hypothetical protein
VCCKCIMSVVMKIVHLKSKNHWFPDIRLYKHCFVFLNRALWYTYLIRTNKIYYIKKQQDATLAVLFISNHKITLHVRTLPASIIRSTKNCSSDLGRPCWIHIIPTHDTHQWMLLQFLVLLMMDAESSETCRVILQLLINNTAKVASCWFFI